MKARVLDASVVAAAFLQEPHAKAARSLLTSKLELLAPDLIVAELANVIWKRRSRGEIDAAEARELLRDFLSLPLRLTASDELAESALELAMRTGRSVYDSLYLALAVKARSVMVTADKRLVNSLAATPLAKHVAWIGNIG